jgi:hypothetical protein
MAVAWIQIRNSGIHVAHGRLHQTSSCAQGTNTCLAAAPLWSKAERGVPQSQQRVLWFAQLVAFHPRYSMWQLWHSQTALLPPVLVQVEEQTGMSNPKFGGPLRVYYVAGEALERFSQVGLGGGAV